MEMGTLRLKFGLGPNGVVNGRIRFAGVAVMAATCWGVPKWTLSWLFKLAKGRGGVRFAKLNGVWIDPKGRGMGTMGRSPRSGM